MLRLFRWLGGLGPLLALALLCTPCGTVHAQSVDSTTNSATENSTTVVWPTPTTSARPWTRWWWHGSAVDDANLSPLLQTYHDAGLGGVEITCIYSVKDNEARNLDYRSDAWVHVIQHVIHQASQLGMQVDLPAGSGWRMGGPNVTMDLANSRVVLETDHAHGGQVFTKRFSKTTPQAIVARNDAGEQLTLTDQLTDHHLQWQPPAGDWTVYSLAYRWSGDRVKRPGPGGGGLNINPYWDRSVTAFLDDFDTTLDQLPGLRAQFHDSFEYQGDWQPELLDEFARRRGYDLAQYLPALTGAGDADLVGRIKSDYRETISDLLLDDFITPWVDWAHKHGQLARNQSHGSPANWLDLYAACDIPETESFGRVDGGDAEKLVFKFASSAAHLMGKPLVSSESATWLGEHFTVNLDDIKQVLDKQMLGGINHILYHGTAYSPADAAWPGWLFYASTQVNPQNPIWHDLPTLNQYVTRCQSVLQASQPDNNVLLYWPIYDLWHDAEGLRRDLTVHNSEHWLRGSPLGHAAQWYDDHGIQFDYVSDRGLARCQPGDQGTITAPGGRYKLIVVPQAKYLPVATLEHLATLAEAGATVAFWKQLPNSEPGLAGSSPSDRWQAAMARIDQLIDQGRVVVGDDLATSITAAHIAPEQPLKSLGIDLLRKRWNGGRCYLLKNTTDQPIDQWVTPAAAGQTAAVLDPMTGTIGLAASKPADSGLLSIRLQMKPGECLLLFVSPESLAVAPWPYYQVVDRSVTLSGDWQVEFLTGGPTLPKSFTSSKPVPWTEAPDAEAQRFAGTVRYVTTFSSPAPEQTRWLLDLGKVDGSARVTLNGEAVATLLGPPYQVVIDTKSDEANHLQVDVTGVAANRIRDLDRRGVEWRIFEDINLVNKSYKPFDASGWPVRPLGLSGPVQLLPIEPSE